MSKKISVYNATYGKIINEINRSDSTRASSVGKGQEYYDNSDNDGDDPDPEGFEIAKAVDYLTEYFLEDAIRLGYDNIDDYAVEQLGYDENMGEPGTQLIEDSIPSYFRDEL
jgi:hypothetical protein